MILAPMLDLCIPNGFLCRPSLLFGTWRFIIAVRASAKIRRTAAIICPVGNGRAGDA